MRTALLALLVLPLTMATGCDRPPAVIPPPDGGRDAGAETLDAGPMADAGPHDASMGDGSIADAGMPGDGGPRPDGGLPPGASVPAPESEVIRMGTGGLLLRGTILTADGVIEGEVLVVGDTIRCVAASCAAMPEASTVTVIDTHATISPGLIDGHNHITYNFLDEWVPDPMRLFMNRYDWRADPDYRAHVAPESMGGSSGSFVCPATKWAELRSIIHGTTTIQGQSPEQSCANRLARNADHFHGLGDDHLRTTIAGPCESALGDSARPGIIASFSTGTTRYAVHMAEGVGGGGVATSVASELDCYAGRTRATTSLLRAPDGTAYGTAIFIHAVPFDDADVMESIDTGSHFVWSPSSNILLYGGTAPIARMLELGAVVGMGPDWTVSGSDEMLSEMRYAHDYGVAESIEALTPQRIWEMATFDGAEVVGLEAAIGRIAVGYRADLVVFGRVATDPYRAVLESRAADVRLVTIDGLGYYGDLALEAATAVNSLCDNVDACGSPKYLCAEGTPGAASRADESVEDIRMQLADHLAASGRVGEEPLALIDCSL